MQPGIEPQHPLDPDDRVAEGLHLAAAVGAHQAKLRAANEPDGLAKALIQTVEYRAATPSRLEEVLFYDHPSVSRRIENAMRWKAAHPPATPATSSEAPAR